MAQWIVERLKEKFPSGVKGHEESFGAHVVLVEPSQLVEIAKFLRDDPEMDFNMPIDCTSVDWFERREPRFDVIYILYSVAKKHRIRLKMHVPEDNPTVPSLTPLWKGLNWFEREAWDLYGIRFEGHPNLKRVLLYDEFVGHPLRKDYPIDKRQPLIEMRETRREVPTQKRPPADMLNRP